MSLWTTIKGILGIGASAAASAPLGGIPEAVIAGAKLGKTALDTKREGDRNATERGISKEKQDVDTAIDQAIKKATQNGAALLLMGLLAIGASGCASVPARDSATATGNVERLLTRPDFTPAAQAAPEWTRDALKTVNSLEADIQRERARANQVQ